MTCIWAVMITLVIDALSTCYFVGRERPVLKPGPAGFGVLFNLDLIGWDLSLVAS